MAAGLHNIPALPTALEDMQVTVGGSHREKGNQQLGTWPGCAAETLGRKLSKVPGKGHQR